MRITPIPIPTPMPIEWESLSLPTGALPNLHTLKCASRMATALLRTHSAMANLRTLLDVGLDLYVGLDPDVDDEGPATGTWSDEDESEVVQQLLQGIAAHPSITTISFSLRMQPRQLATLGVAAPQITSLSIEEDYDFPRTGVDWIESLSCFPCLKRLEWAGGDPFLGSAHMRVSQLIARDWMKVCPKLQVIIDNHRKTMHIDRPGAGSSCTTWVRRANNGSSEPVILDSDEEVYKSENTVD
ncbi:hypothetical protein NEOLEDRAFT_1241662 [Neolentinus lepideus HHB14362 ss-1]|uniref:F-box domain-containing protein n=1 Tax=Neolentinus lepideus HHB14362 ss-1 TaxID=1314782 RepID=A0A165SPG9_9AGAM|nr:hypothetical protein NEOLEDRAFT_1241662 [Neolentinus lepideus HHB14362 ss-1]